MSAAGTGVVSPRSRGRSAGPSVTFVVRQAISVRACPRPVVRATILTAGISRGSRTVLEQGRRAAAEQGADDVVAPNGLSACGGVAKPISCRIVRERAGKLGICCGPSAGRTSYRAHPLHWRERERVDQAARSGVAPRAGGRRPWLAFRMREKWRAEARRAYTLPKMRKPE